MSKKKKTITEPLPTANVQKPSDLKFWLKYLLILGAVLIIGAVVFYFVKNSSKRTIRPIGFAGGCKVSPPFSKTLGFGQNSALSTSEKGKEGLWLIDQTGKKYHHPSWKLAGFLAPIQLDSRGNVFVAPAPTINVLLNPPDRQNAIYRVDGNTQEMKKFVDLPSAEKSGEQNPFGAMGLALDCDSQNLYVSTVSGSTRDKQIGRIFPVNSKTAKIGHSLENVDAMGLAVFNGAKGKRLYFGLLRNSEVWSIDLDDNGDFVSEPRLEFSLDGLGVRGNDKARRISFSLQGEMLVFGIEFDFNLIAPTEKQETIYRFRYDSKNDKFVYIEEPPEVVK